MSEVKQIGTRIRVLLASGKVKNFKQIFPLDALPKSRCVLQSRDYRVLKNLKVKAWGLQIVYNTPSGDPPTDRIDYLNKQN